MNVHDLQFIYNVQYFYGILLYNTELEIILPTWSNLTRVVPQLSGGAHYLLPGKNGAASVAVRVYDKAYINCMDEEYKKKQHALPLGTSIAEDVDDLCLFRDTYKFPVIFFVLPQGSMQNEQLSDLKSFTMRAQMALASIQQNGKRGESNDSTKKVSHSINN